MHPASGQRSLSAHPSAKFFRKKPENPGKPRKKAHSALSGATAIETPQLRWAGFLPQLLQLDSLPAHVSMESRPVAVGNASWRARGADSEVCRNFLSNGDDYREAAVWLALSPPPISGVSWAARVEVRPEPGLCLHRVPGPQIGFAIASIGCHRGVARFARGLRACPWQFASSPPGRALPPSEPCNPAPPCGWRACSAPNPDSIPAAAHDARPPPVPAGAESAGSKAADSRAGDSGSRSLSRSLPPAATPSPTGPGRFQRRARNAAFGLRRVGCDPLDVELLQRPSNLGQLLLRSIPRMDGPRRDLK